MSRDLSSEQPSAASPVHDPQQLFEELGHEVRASQRATDIVDDLVCRLLEINRTDARCLDILDQHGSMSAGELAQATRLTTGAITAVVDRLERSGYAHRVHDPSDRRKVLIELTPKSYAMSSELMAEPLAELSRPLIERYTDEQLRMLIDFTRAGREIQERHAEWLQQRLEERG